MLCASLQVKHALLCLTEQQMTSVLTFSPLTTYFAGASQELKVEGQMHTAAADMCTIVGCAFEAMEVMLETAALQRLHRCCLRR